MKLKLTLLILIIGISNSSKSQIINPLSQSKLSDTITRRKLNISVIHPIALLYPKFRTQIDFPLRNNKSYIGFVFNLIMPKDGGMNAGIEYKRKKDFDNYNQIEDGFYINLLGGFWWALDPANYTDNLIHEYSLCYITSAGGVYIRKYFGRTQKFYFESETGIRFGTTLNGSYNKEDFIFYISSPLSLVDMRFNFGMHF